MPDPTGNDTPELVVVDIPSEYAEAGFLSSCKTEDGKLDINKALKKMQNQESILGKRALPNKDSTDAEIDEFISKMNEATKDANIDPLFEGVEDADDMKKVLKENGLLPKQIKNIVEAWKAAKAKDMSQEKYDEYCKSIGLTEEEKQLAKSVMTDEMWNETNKYKSKEAAGILKIVAQQAKKYNITEKSIGAGTTSGTPDIQKKGFCPEYHKEMMDAAARGASQKEKDAIMSKYGYNHEKGGWDL